MYIYGGETMDHISDDCLWLFVCFVIDRKLDSRSMQLTVMCNQYPVARHGVAM